MMINLSLLARLHAIEKSYLHILLNKGIPYARYEEDDESGETGGKGSKGTSWEDWVKGSDEGGSGGSTAKGLRGKNDLAAKAIAKARKLSR